MAANDHAERIEQQFLAFLGRNPQAAFARDRLTDTAYLESLDWDGEDRHGTLEILHAISRLAPVENDPERAYALLRSGYRSAFQIAGEQPARFLAKVAQNLSAAAAWPIYKRAKDMRSVAMHRWMAAREAVSPVQRAMQGPRRASTISPAELAPGLDVNFASMFGEAPFADVPHDASILGPGAYFVDLLAAVEQVLAAQGGGDIPLRLRRPDLWNLPLTLANATQEISNADLTLEILESTLDAAPASAWPLMPVQYPAGVPPVVQQADSWPTIFVSGTTYVLDNASAIEVTALASIDGSVTLRSARGMQLVSGGAYPIQVGANRGGTVVLEGFSFAWTPSSNPPVPIFQFFSGTLILRNCVFLATDPNTFNGWAVQCAKTDPEAAGAILFENCTLADASTSAPHIAIDASLGGLLTVSLRNSIVWSDNVPSAMQPLVMGGATTAIMAESCCVTGGRLAFQLSGAADASLLYRDTNFDENPIFAQGSYSKLDSASPCIGRGSNGNSIGASSDVYDALRWAVYPFEFPFDVELETARLSLDALDVSLEDIANVFSTISASAPTPYFPVSQLGLSLQDYQLLTTPLASGLEVYYGLNQPFAQSSIVVSPASNPLLFPATQFAEWIGCTPDELRELIYQDLSPSEIQSGIQAGAQVAGLSAWNGFFINGYALSSTPAPACMALALSTQYVPVGRYALNFEAGSQVYVQLPALAVTKGFTVSFWLFQLASQTATVLTAGPAGSTVCWQLNDTMLTVGLPGAPAVNAVDLSAALLMMSSGARLRSGFGPMPQWVHIATIYDSNACTLTTYVNGERASQAANLATATWPATPVNLGASATPADWFTGAIAELAIWNIPLSADQILSGFQRPPMAETGASVQIPAGLVAYFPLDDNASSVRNCAGGPSGAVFPAQAVFAPIGLPSFSPAPMQSATKDGLSFVQMELLTGRNAGLISTSDAKDRTATQGTPVSDDLQTQLFGVGYGNLDRINRFVRLARRTGLAFAELDWALFTLFQSDLQSSWDLNSPDLFANLTLMDSLRQALGIGLNELCAFFGCLKPIGRGLTGERLTQFDLLYNRPPFAAPVFSPDIALVLNVGKDFATPGLVARRLAQMLTLTPDELTAIVRRLEDTNGFTLDSASLTAIYRYRVLAGWLGASIDAALDALDIAEFSPLACTPQDLYTFVRTAGWISDAGCEPRDLKFLKAAPGALPEGPYQQKISTEVHDGLPALLDGIERGLAPWRVGPTSFISGQVTEAQSAALYLQLLGNEDQGQSGLITPNGVVTSVCLAQLPEAPLRVPSLAYPTVGAALQAAAAAMSNGLNAATVLVNKGVYSETSLNVTIPSGTLTIQSTSGPEETIVDFVGKSGWIFNPGNGASPALVLRGLTLRNAAQPAGSGGALMSSCQSLLENCVFQNNSAANGGAVALVQASTSPAACTVNNCVFLSNSASTQGGAISLNNTSLTLRSSSFSSNASPQETTNTFYQGGASAVTVINCIVWNGGAEWNGSVLVSYSDVDVASIVPPGTQPDSNGNINADPKWIDAANGLFGLSDDSPCLQNGANGANMGYDPLYEDLSPQFSLYPFAYAQTEVLRKELSIFYQNADLPVEAVLGALGGMYNGLEVLQPGYDASEQSTYLRMVYQYLLLAYLFDMDEQLMRIFFRQPALLSLSGTPGVWQPTLSDMHILARFARLRKDRPDLQEPLLAWLDASVRRDASATVESLAALMGWNLDDLTALLAAGNTPVPSALGPILDFQMAIDLSINSRIDIPLLLSLYQNGLIFGAGGAQPLVSAVIAANPEAAQALRTAVVDSKRIRLKQFAQPLFNALMPDGFPIIDDAGLSDFLLIDVDMGAATTTSRLVQATLSLQQYIQRCRLGLEPGIGTIGPLDAEWNWMSSYRTWEANRKVFVYPETYLRPELRKSRTPLFADLEHALSSCEMTKDGLETLYRRYLDQFAILANLETVGTWYEPDHSIDTSAIVNTPHSGLPRGQYVLCFNTNWNSNTTLTTLTVEAWVRIRSGEVFLGAETVVGLNGRMQLKITGNGQAIFSMKTMPGSLGNPTVLDGPILEREAWYHLCGVFNNGTMLFYVNGDLVAPSVSVRPPSMGGAGQIGFSVGDSSGSPASYPLEVAEVRFWQCARTQDQIVARMKTRIDLVGPDTLNLSGYWSFANASNSDRMGNWTTTSGPVPLTFLSSPYDLITGEPALVSAYHFIGRTRTEPFRFFHRARELNRTAMTAVTESGALWTPWEGIGVDADTPYLTPVILHGRLYAFWVELHMMPKNPNAKEHTDEHFEAHLKYTWRNADGSWTAPQSPFPAIPLPSAMDRTTIEQSPVWSKPYVVPVMFDNARALLVIYGASVTFVDGTSAGPWAFVLQWDQSVVSGLHVGAGNNVYSTLLTYALPALSGINTVAAAFSQNILAANYFVPFDNAKPTPGALLLVRADPQAEVLPVSNQLGAYTLSTGGSEFLIEAWTPVNSSRLSVQVIAGIIIDPLLHHRTVVLSAQATDFSQAQFTFQRLSSTAVPALLKALAEDGIDGLLSQVSQRAAETPFDRLAPQYVGAGSPGCVLPFSEDAISFNLSSAYGLYYREIFFFIPWLIADRLRLAGSFAEAQTFLEYIFNPAASASAAGCWQSVWLSGVSADRTIGFLESPEPAALILYRRDPFNATAIADVRPGAWQKAIVTAFVRNLIAWGDSLFTRNSRESINQADQLYRFAGNVLGPRPHLVAYTPPPPETYAELSLQKDSEFLYALAESGELDAFDPAGILPEGQDPNGSVLGAGLYFGVPDSPEFLSNWDDVEDRLYKIRNGLDLSGAPNALALFDQPLSPTDIQRLGSAAAMGAAGFNTSAPFALHQDPEAVLISLKSLVGSVIEFGNSLLRALEAKSAEDLASLQAQQQRAMAEQICRIRSDEVNNASAALDALRKQVEAAQWRAGYYSQLQKDGWNPAEASGVALAGAAMLVRAGAARANLIAAPEKWLPTIFGMANGGQDPGGSMQAAAAALSDAAMILSESAGLANTIGNYQRRSQEWAMQQKLAEYDVQQIEAQIRSAEFVLNAAQSQYAAEQLNWNNARVLEQYYRDKFTSAELYGWMAETLGELYHQMYQVALGVARIFQDLISDDVSGGMFLSGATWNAQRRGLLAGETLMLDVARMEQAWLQSKVQNCSANKVISLVKLNPAAYLDLIRSGECTFELPQSLFDRDHPGQYMRRLKRIAVRLPGTEEFATQIHGSLTRVAHQIVRRPEIEPVAFLNGDFRALRAGPGSVLERDSQPVEAMLSHSLDSSGAFDSGSLTMFAGGGAVSRWRLKLPLEANRFDFRAIGDIEIAVTYTARSGADGYRRSVATSQAALSGSLLIDLAREIPDAWHALAKQAAEKDCWTVRVPLRRNMLPRNLAGRSWTLTAVHAGTYNGDARNIQLTWQRNEGAKRVAFGPYNAGSGVASAVPETTIGNFLEDQWILHCNAAEGSASPADLVGDGLWLMVDYAEV